jgi:hypothetical protein
MATRNDGMPLRLSKVDELTFGQHTALQQGDECLFWGEYQAGKDYRAGATNSLISNLKKSPTLRGTAQYQYKEHAIRTAGNALAGPFRASRGGPFTIVPTPPSKEQTDPEYDDRIVQIARIMIAGTTSEVRELVRQTASYDASHAAGGGHRMSAAELMAIYEIAPDEPKPRDIVFVLDDMLTVGSHFRAMKDTILARFPGKRVVGLFIARRVPANPADDCI